MDCLNRRLCAVFTVALVIPAALGHVAAWNKGMYCLNGTTVGEPNEDNALPANPLWQLRREDWWMHHVDKCDEFPPAAGDFLELPSGGSFVIELANNRAFTSLSYGGSRVGRFPDGQEHEELDDPRRTSNRSPDEGCVVEPNLHTPNEEQAAGTAFAISYNSDIKQVTPENLVVFSVLYHTPWKRLVEYQVPNLPACPPDGCHCVWGWVPKGCGEPNMYMQPFRCKVVGQTGTKRVAPARPPVWCEGNPDACTTGPKQMVFWNQLEGNNVFMEGRDRSGLPRAPTYNMRMGFPNGAQTDIFLEESTVTPTSIAPASSSTAPGVPEPSFSPGSPSPGSNATRALPSWLLVALLHLSVGFRVLL